MIESAEAVRVRIAERFPNAKVVVEGPALVVDRANLIEVMRFLRDDDALKLDFLSSVTAVDWPDKKYLETVYHLFSVALRHGPLVVKCRTGDRAEDARMPSVTPLWRGAEYQEREGYDLYGIVYEGHPDLRRILMWDEFTDFPMRKDYVSPPDFEWEPTPHEDIVGRIKEQRGIKDE